MIKRRHTGRFRRTLSFRCALNLLSRLYFQQETVRKLTIISLSDLVMWLLNVLGNDALPPAIAISHDIHETKTAAYFLSVKN